MGGDTNSDSTDNRTNISLSLEGSTSGNSSNVSRAVDLGGGCKEVERSGLLNN
jgi:hypothetical protein